MVMPGVTIRNASEKRASCGLASLFSVCQAMSIAMTTVLPRAGRHLEGDAEELWVGIGVGLAQVVVDPGVAVFLGDLGDVDERFEGLDLAEEQPPAAVGSGSSVRAGGP